MGKKTTKQAAETPIISELPWFRLVANKDGTVASVEEFSGARDDKGRSVHFVQARDRADAIKVWSVKYVDRLAAACAGRNKRRADRKAAGICENCGGPLAINSSCYCTECNTRRLQLRRERRAGRAPMTQKIPNTPEARAASEISRQEYRRDYHKRAVDRDATRARQIYYSALDAFDSMPPARFRGWLVSKIQEQQDKIEAKRAAAGLPKQADSNTARVIAAALAQPRKHSTARVDTGARKAG